MWVKQTLGVFTRRTPHQPPDLVMERISGSRQAAAVFSSALILPIILHLLAREEGNKFKMMVIITIGPCPPQHSPSNYLSNPRKWSRRMRELQQLTLGLIQGVRSPRYCHGDSVQGRRHTKDEFNFFFLFDPLY